MTLKLDRPLNPDRDRWFLGTLDSLLAVKEDTNGVYSVILRYAPKGFSPPLHTHEREDTGFLILDGKVTMRVGDKEVTAGPHEFFFAPRGVPHWFRVESETARFLEIVTPGGFESFHRAMSEPALAFDLPPSDARIPSREEMAVESARVGTRLHNDNE